MRKRSKQQHVQYKLFDCLIIKYGEHLNTWGQQRIGSYYYPRIPQEQPRIPQDSHDYPRITNDYPRISPGLLFYPRIPSDYPSGLLWLPKNTQGLLLLPKYTPMKDSWTWMWLPKYTPGLLVLSKGTPWLPKDTPCLLLFPNNTPIFHMITLWLPIHLTLLCINL